MRRCLLLRGVIALPLLLMSACDDPSRSDPTVLSVQPLPADTLSAHDLGAQKLAVALAVPSGQLVVVTTLVFRNRSLDHTLSSEHLLLSADATTLPVCAMIFEPHGPLRPAATTWLLVLPFMVTLEVHDSPDLFLRRLPVADQETFARDRALLLAIDPDGEVSSPPRSGQLMAAHVSALVLVRRETVQANDPRLAGVIAGGALLPHAHVETQHALSQPDQHYLDLVKALGTPVSAASASASGSASPTPSPHH